MTKSKLFHLVNQVLKGVEKELITRKPDGLSDGEYVRRMSYLHGGKETAEKILRNLELEYQKENQ